MTTPHARVLLADDNEVIRAGLVGLLSLDPRLTVVGQAADGQEAVELAEQLQPDVVLLDVRMPRLDGLGAARELAPRFPVLMLTYSDEDDIVRAALAAGARGYLLHGTFTPEHLHEAVLGTCAGDAHLSPKAAGVLVRSVRQQLAPDLPPVARGARFGLSPRECDVAERMARGLSNREIAAELYLAESTVKNTVNRLFAKLAVTSRGQAIATWLGTDG